MAEHLGEDQDYSCRGSQNFILSILLKDVFGLPIACWLTLAAGGALGGLLAATTKVG
jgi:hypothetical protein